MSACFVTSQKGSTRSLSNHLIGLFGSEPSRRGVRKTVLSPVSRVEDQPRVVRHAHRRNPSRASRSSSVKPPGPRATERTAAVSVG